MKAIIGSSRLLSGIASASAMEYIDGQLWIAGDDSPFLYTCSPDGEILSQIRLFEGEGRIPKKQKADIECSFQLSDQESGKPCIYLLGSGSGPLRKELIRIDLSSGKLSRQDLAQLYDLIRSTKGFFGEKKQNFEGAASDGNHIYLFHRGNITGRNRVVVIEVSDWKIFETEAKLPQMKVVEIELPVIEGCRLGFSGADYLALGNQLVYCASAERTGSAWDDGEIVGSFVGVLELPLTSQQIGAGQLASVEEFGKLAKVKVEAISIFRYSEKILLKGVTDDDKGNSLLLDMELHL